MKTLTKQAAFDKVARHLLTQGEQCLGENGECVYRNAEGLKCAAGALISNRLYRKNFDQPDKHRGSTAINRIVEDAGDETKVLGATLGEGTLDLIGALQLIHDSYQAKDWFLNLEELAARERLDPSVLDKFREAK